MLGALSIPGLVFCILLGVAVHGWLIFKPGSQGGAEPGRTNPKQPHSR